MGKGVATAVPYSILNRCAAVAWVGSSGSAAEAASPGRSPIGQGKATLALMGLAKRRRAGGAEEGGVKSACIGPDPALYFATLSNAVYTLIM